MNRIVKLVLCIVFTGILLVSLTGCANVNYEITLQKDGSGEITYIMGYDKSFLNSMQVSIDTLKDSNSLEQTKQEATQAGYSVEEYEDENTYGFKAYKHVSNIQNEFKMMEDSSESDAIQYEKSLLKITFSQDAKLDLSNVTGDEEDDALTTAILGQMKISYKIVLPFKVGDNNATTVSEDGKTIEWELKAGQTNEIKFIAQQDNTIMVVGAIAVILVIILVIIMMISGKSKKAGKRGK